MAHPLRLQFPSALYLITARGNARADKESHFLELCRYVVLNPVRAGMVRSVRDWAWSS